jgi:hypothetical protein
MKLLGLGATMRWANRYNRLRFGSNHKMRQQLWREHFHALVEENGTPQHPPIAMTDGWAIDRSQTLPHLAEMLDDADKIIQKRGEHPADDFGKPFLRSIMTADDLNQSPSILNFATSSQMVATVARECGFIPMLGNSMPPGVRLMESTTKFDPQPTGPWRSSQLWHLDYHSSPTIYVVVALRDITPDMGPLMFLSRSDSEQVAAALKYRRKGAAYRVSDEAMNAVIGNCKIHQFVAPAGTVLFLDSNQCFHYGSRNPASPRYHMQYAYLCACRSDFGDISRRQFAYKTAENDSRLRRLVLERNYLC